MTVFILAKAEKTSILQLKPTYIPEETATNRNRIILDESYSHETFSFQQNSKGRCRITVLKENAFLIVANHLGDVESAKVKVNGSLELIRNFRQFIEVCGKLASQLEIDKNEVFPGFEVLYMADPVRVRLKNTLIEYTMTDILNVYFSYLINSTVELEPGRVSVCLSEPSVSTHFKFLSLKTSYSLIRLSLRNRT